MYSNTKNILSVIIIHLFLVHNVSFAQNYSRTEYIEEYSELAIKEMKRTGIPASITMAQAILESDNGNSKLAKKANNHFGIKCHSDWNGPTIKHDDDKKNECFRKYKNAEESFRDHSDFLTGKSRYNKLFELNSKNYKGWARGLQKAGYATSSTYANKLISLIETHRLYELDTKGRVVITDNNKPVSSPENTTIQTGSHQIQQRNRVAFVVAQQGDTYEKITGEFDKMRWELWKYNNVAEGALLKPGQIVYLQPKRNKAERQHKYHEVAKGETMWYISQKYAVKLMKLYKLNRLEPGTEPDIGDKIWLRKKKNRH